MKLCLTKNKSLINLKKYWLGVTIFYVGIFSHTNIHNH